MKRSGILIVAVIVLMFTASGCVQTQVTRQISIHKDVNGKVTGYTEVESATQRGAAFKFSGFEYLKGGPGETEPLKLY